MLPRRFKPEPHDSGGWQRKNPSRQVGEFLGNTHGSVHGLTYSDNVFDGGNDVVHVEGEAKLLMEAKSGVNSPFPAQGFSEYGYGP